MCMPTFLSLGVRVCRKYHFWHFLKLHAPQKVVWSGISFWGGGGGGGEGAKKPISVKDASSLKSR